MITEVVNTERNPEAGTQKGARIIRAGGLVAFPTETVYGLGANGLNEEAVRLMRATARRSRSRKVARAAPRESSSRPMAPDPAKASSTDVPERSSPAAERIMEAICSRVRSVVGRVTSRPSGASICLPLHLPPTILMLSPTPRSTRETCLAPPARGGGPAPA